jgi:5,10-methylenetetrahydromethanopterin reductase
VEISCAFATGPDTPEQIAIAEQLGYSRAWAYDSPALYPDVWVTLALAAERTSRIGLGPAVLVPNLRHPLAQASAIATLEGLAPGRVAAAFGTGFTGRRAMGQRPLTWRFVEQYLSQVKALLSGEQVEVDGAIVKMIPPDGYLPPRPLNVPLLVSAHGPKGHAVTRKLADGIMSVGSPQPGYDWSALLIWGTVLDEGESPTSERALDAAGFAAGLTYHAMYEADPESVLNLPNGAAWREAIERLPEEIRHLTTHELHMVGTNAVDAEHAGFEALMPRFAMSADDWAARLSALEERGATEVMYQPAGSDIPGELERFAQAADRFRALDGGG